MNYDFYDDMSVLHGYMPHVSNNNINLYDSYEGFLKGNAFRNLYVPYKNYQPQKINFSSEKDELLFSISEYAFMMHDLNLYLDVYPNDMDALNKFNEYRNKCNELREKYERRYGPLMVRNSDVKIPFNWIKEWPWVN